MLCLKILLKIQCVVTQTKEKRIAFFVISNKKNSTAWQRVFLAENWGWGNEEKHYQHLNLYTSVSMS